MNISINKVKVILLLLSLGILAACSPDDKVDDVALPELNSETWVEGPLDIWLYDNFLVAYNIEVKYRFDRNELALNRTLVPPKEEKVIPVMETIRETWIEPYELAAGPNFIKKLSPKQFVLVGSPEFNPNGTITLGTAEGGRKVVLYVINDFDRKDKPQVKQMLHTIHHEFAHILHQTVMYQEEYKRITSNYTASWNDFSLEDARSRGFITQYARSSPDEDFVEMVSIMLIEGKAGFDAIVESAPEEVQPHFREKEQLVVNYFKETWNIDIYTLMVNTQAAINAL